MGASKSKDVCVIERTDPRLTGHDVWYDLNNMKCTMTIMDDQDAKSSGGKDARRASTSSIFAPQSTPIIAALAVTDQCFIMELKRPKKDKVQQQYLHVTYDDPMCREISLSFSNDADGSHLVIMLPDAKRFLKTGEKELKMPEGATVKVDMVTYQAPDICMHVKGKLSPVTGI